MVEWTQLLLPIALSAVFVFFLSSIIHMVIKWHNVDYRKLPDEDAVGEALRAGNLSPGQYIIPHCVDPGDMSPELEKKFADGPVGVMYIKPNGQMNLGPILGKWFVFLIVVSAVVAYLARAQLAANVPYLSVFRLTGTTAWLAYSFSGAADSIWMGKPWKVTAKELVDGFLYALLTAGTFAWLWPRPD